MADKIEKTATLKAPLAKVWNAISDSTAFATWFGLTLEGPFVEGRTTKGIRGRSPTWGRTRRRPS
jgi:uncharacterized protein YndB with AHSA1/START domain